VRLLVGSQLLKSILLQNQAGGVYSAPCSFKNINGDLNNTCIHTDLGFKILFFDLVCATFCHTLRRLFYFVISYIFLHDQEGWALGYINYGADKF
jgi:hypothetical protein